MASHLTRVKLIVAAAALVVVGLLFAGGPASAQSAENLTPQEMRGKQIYLKGESEGGEMSAYLGSNDLELPASSFSCANCHGARGEGLKEGGLEPPPINWATLVSKHRSALTGRDRPPYTEATLARAISTGIGPAGGRLHPGMPHYKMSEGQMADLIAYLKKIGGGSDLDPGVSEEAIKIGAALPMTGPLASVGEDVKAALAAYFAEINSQGGVYGRRFELLVEDSRGEPTPTVEATRRLVEQHGVYALLASFERGDNDAVNEYLRREQVPLIGPVTLSPRMAALPNPYIFYLLPAFGDQARSLADFVAARAAESEGGARPRIAVVCAESDFDRSARDGLLAQAKLHGMEVVFDDSFEHGRLQAASVVGSLAAKKPGAIFFFGGPDDFAALAREVGRSKLDSILLSSTAMVGRAAFELPAAIAARTYLAYPSALPNPDNFAEFLAVMQKHNVKLRNAAFQSVAFAAAKLLVEATKSSGRHLTRASLINALEQLRDFRTGVVPPVSFGPNRRVGATGSYVVGIDPASKEYKPLGERIVPKGSER